MPKKSKSKDIDPILSSIISKLTPKMLALLMSLGLILLSFVLSIAVLKGADLSLMGIKISFASKNNNQIQPSSNKKHESIRVRLNIHMDKTSFNPRKDITVMGYIKSMDGKELPIDIRHGVDPGGLFVETEIPDINTPLFIEVKTPNGIWKTDDFSITQFHLNAYKIDATV